MQIDSCGLQQINLESEVGRIIYKKLDVKPNEKYIKDAVRSCSCGKIEIYYAWTLDYIKKYCNGCGAFELKSSKIVL